MKRNLKVKMGERNLREELDRQAARYQRAKKLLEQALSHRYRLEQAVKATAVHDGTCWCGVNAFKLMESRKECILHTVACDQLYLALYGAERGE